MLPSYSVRGVRERLLVRPPVVARVSEAREPQPVEQRGCQHLPRLMARLALVLQVSLAVHVWVRLALAPVAVREAERCVLEQLPILVSRLVARVWVVRGQLAWRLLRPLLAALVATDPTSVAQSRPQAQRVLWLTQQVVDVVASLLVPRLLLRLLVSLDDEGAPPRLVDRPKVQDVQQQALARLRLLLPTPLVAHSLLAPPQRPRAHLPELVLSAPLALVLRLRPLAPQPARLIWSVHRRLAPLPVWLVIVHLLRLPVLWVPHHPLPSQHVLVGFVVWLAVVATVALRLLVEVPVQRKPLALDQRQHCQERPAVAKRVRELLARLLVFLSGLSALSLTRTRLLRLEQDLLARLP